MYSFNKKGDVKFSQVVVGHIFAGSANYYVKINNTQAVELITDNPEVPKKVVTYTKNQLDSRVTKVEIAPS